MLNHKIIKISQKIIPLSVGWQQMWRLSDRWEVRGHGSSLYCDLSPVLQPRLGQMCWQSTLFYQVKVILFQSSPSNIDVWLFRETNDAEEDTETIHTIKNIFYRDPSDIAIVELHASVNNCSDSDKCWKITPVHLPPADINIRNNQTVRALGNFTEIFPLFWEWRD